jgi:hypothetical protein
MSDKKCFIVMPITTPSDYVDLYSGDKDHFKHVLEHLFVPAIKGIGLEPVPPITKGSEVIHAEIIKNIESSDYVLCDMSILNPNVFFELGIRTAINRPVALVKDDATPKVPFDTNIINNHTYLNNLAPWTLESEIKKLSQHLEYCFKESEINNSLWKYFSLSAKASTLEEPSKDEDKLSYLSLQVDALRKELRKSNNSEEDDQPRKHDSIEEGLFNKFVSLASGTGVTIKKGSWANDGKMLIETTDPSPKELIVQFAELAEAAGIELKVTATKAKS